jgi:hypothetical protein
MEQGAESSLNKLFVDPQPTSKSQTAPKQIKTLLQVMDKPVTMQGTKRQAQKNASDKALACWGIFNVQHEEKVDNIKYKILTQKCENLDNTSEKLFKYQHLGQSLLLADPKH